MSSARVPKARRAHAKTARALRDWLASPSGQERMEQAARDAAKARAEIDERARVPGYVLRAPVTM